MGRRKKKLGAGDLIVAGIVGTLALLAAIPKEIWITIGVIGLIYFYMKHVKAKITGTLNEARSGNRETAKISTPAIKAGLNDRYSDDNSSAVLTAVPAFATDSSFRIPSAPKEFGAASWIPCGQSIKIAGIAIHRG